MAETRSKASYWNILLDNQRTILRNLLTSVLRFYFYHHKKETFCQTDDVKAVVSKVCEVWAKATYS